MSEYTKIFREQVAILIVFLHSMKSCGLESYLLYEIGVLLFLVDFANKL